jgi:hypothetical protein
VEDGKRKLCYAEEYDVIPNSAPTKDDCLKNYDLLGGSSSGSSSIMMSAALILASFMAAMLF